MSVEGRVGLEMDARLDDDLAAALRDKAGLDGGEDLVVGDGERFDVERVEIIDVDGFMVLALSIW